MISIRMADGVSLIAYTEKIEDFTRRYIDALQGFEPLELERPNDKHSRYINPFQVLYYELKE